ncbi:DapH/DapD/GlmU-related protein [Ferruginibacter sp. HRS2-29]|uniref:acyltransferase n=1 Tax=Ferruginibacter sp. HRS2-29 TaxID=2487334 RepID=UPI0020CEA5DD|nr:acyltransferase [Ferruginibacter sp. HRS2-29]MCP9749910.1 acyltransferase [Ferruginibacter sp. HRS2-29]
MNEISASAKISSMADIETSSRGSRLYVGENVMIDSFVKIKFTGGAGDIRIGNNSYVNSGCVLYSGNGITIGDHVLIAANCTFAPVNHQYMAKDKTILEQRFKESKGGIIIEDDVWIGAGVIILDGAHIRKGTVIGAAAVVSGTTEEYGVYVGNPLTLVKFRS